MIGGGRAARSVVAAALAAVFVALPAGTALPATTLLPSDFRPVAAEGSARAAWVNPSGIGSSPWQSLVVEVSALEQADGMFDTGELAVLSLAASTGRTAYAFRRELDDVEGVPDWALIIANRAVRRNGTIFGTALEWRGGEGQTFDATVSLAAPLGESLRATIVLEDLFAAEVDGLDGSRRWRGGVALRPLGGPAYLSWDIDRLEDADESRHWFGFGIDRLSEYFVTAAVNDRGEWSARLGIRFRNARWSGALREDPDGERTAIVAIDFLGSPVTR